MVQAAPQAVDKDEWTLSDVLGRLVSVIALPVQLLKQVSECPPNVRKGYLVPQEASDMRPFHNDPEDSQSPPWGHPNETHVRT